MIAWAEGFDGLKQNSLSPVYVLVGTEHALIRAFIDKISALQTTESSEFVEISRFRYEDEGCEGAIFACQSFSLFSALPIVVLENCVALTSQPKVKFDTSDLERYLENPVTDRVLVITVLAEKLDVRKKLVKLARKYSVIDCNVQKADEGIPLLQTFADADGIELERDARAELWRRTESVTAGLIELQKLWSYTNGRRISVEDVQQVVSAPLEDNVFAWIDGVVKGNLDLTFRALQDVTRGGYDGFALLALIARQLRLMWFGVVYGRKGYSGQQIAAKASAHPYAVRIAMEQSKGVSQERLERLIVTLADAEYAMKSGRLDIQHALDYVILACFNG